MVDFNYQPQLPDWTINSMKTNLTYPLENDGWKMKFPFQMVPFHSFIFAGV